MSFEEQIMSNYFFGTCTVLKIGKITWISYSPVLTRGYSVTFLSMRHGESLNLESML